MSWVDYFYMDHILGLIINPLRSDIIYQKHSQGERKMKPILMNINEMSDSREVYESKPNPIFAIFIYTILGIIAATLI